MGEFPKTGLPFLGGGGGPLKGILFYLGLYKGYPPCWGNTHIERRCELTVGDWFDDLQISSSAAERGLGSFHS